MADGTEQKDSKDILEEQNRIGFREYQRSNSGLFLSALTAGLEIGFSIFIMGVLITLYNGKVSTDILHAIMALGYPLGFIFVIIGRSELFTEHTALAMIPVLKKRATIKELFRLWGVVIAGNLIGGFLFSLFITWIGPQREIITIEAFEAMALPIIEPDWAVMSGSALLAGWMMGLLGWLVTSSQDSISRIFIVILITAIIGLGKLHHCIVGSVEMICGLLVSNKIQISDYLFFLFFTVAGNTVGGALFVSILKYSQIKIKDF